MRPTLVAAAGLLLWASCSKPEAADPAGARAARAVPVAVAAVQQRDVPVYLDGLGSVTALMTVAVRAQVDGRLDQVFFKEGQVVHRGELLAQIDPRPYLNQLHQAEGQLARDQAQLDVARQDLQRYQDLVKEKLIPQQQLDQQKGLVGQAEGTVRVDQAAVDVARLNLDYARITSPIDGVAGIRALDPGNLVHASDQTGIVVLAQLDPIAVIFTLPQDALTEVARQKAQGTLEVVIFDRDGVQELGRGSLQVIDNAINASTATLRLKAALANPNGGLWPNQFVKARLMLAARKGALVVPSAALQRGQQGTFVYVMVADQTAQPRPVVLDLLQGDDAIIAKGLSPGDSVIVEGQSQLRPGAKVAVRGAGKPADSAAPAAPEGGKPRASAAAPGAARAEHEGRAQPRPASATARESP